MCDSHLWAADPRRAGAWPPRVPALRGNGQPATGRRTSSAPRARCSRPRAWIADERPAPWFAMVNLFDVHWPYLPAKDATRALGARLRRPGERLPLPRRRLPARTTGPTPSDKRARPRPLRRRDVGARPRRRRLPRPASLDGAPRVRAADLRPRRGAGRGRRWSHDELALPQTRVPMLLPRRAACEPGPQHARPGLGHRRRGHAAGPRRRRRRRPASCRSRTRCSRDAARPHPLRGRPRQPARPRRTSTP